MNNTTCGARFNQSDPFFHIGDRYGGIPLNLCTNLLGSLVLMILFLIIRKNAVKSVKDSLTVDARDSVEILMLLFGKQKLRKNTSREDVERVESNEANIYSFFSIGKYCLLQSCMFFHFLRLIFMLMLVYVDIRNV